MIQAYTLKERPLEVLLRATIRPTPAAIRPKAIKAGSKPISDAPVRGIPGTPPPLVPPAPPVPVVGVSSTIIVAVGIAVASIVAVASTVFVATVVPVA
jgi:hypothetical protein